jgi:hypothetical protein
MDMPYKIQCYCSKVSYSVPYGPSRKLILSIDYAICWSIQLLVPFEEWETDDKDVLDGFASLLCDELAGCLSGASYGRESVNSCP